MSLLKGRRTYAGPQAITLATTALTTHRAYEHEVEDKEVEKILTRLQAFGYELQIIERPCVSGYTYMVTYFFAFAIGGFGKCSGFSERSLADAWQKAAVKLKQRYTEHFGGVDEERLLRAVAWKHDHLYPVDLTVVELLKQFHKGKDLEVAYLFRFSNFDLSSSVHPNGDAHHHTGATTRIESHSPNVSTDH